MDKRILQPGENCWRIEHADRAAFLVDAADYFKAVRSALRQARQQVLILGWDIDSRIRLTPLGPDDGYPEKLGEFLDALVSRRPELHIHVLVWDFAMIFALEREWLPNYKLGWQTHRNLHFRMDSNHPAGGSQHQKIIVIDDSLAFSGGMDLGKWRWDTSEHRANDKRRVGPEGTLYPPYHDVQMAVSGKAAARLGELARNRWHRATRQQLKPPKSTVGLWPEWLVPDLEQVDVGISRTDPPYEERPAVNEVEQLFHDAIAAAERRIYIENQYFTSQNVSESLCKRLEEPGGPEIVMVFPKHSTGWLEQHTMDVLRSRTLSRLREADHFGRLAVYYPESPSVAPHYINIHDKVMIVDDRFLRIGSANLSNRSMRLDTECDLAIEANDDASDRPLREAIAHFRNRLIAEHLDCPPEAVARLLQDQHSIASVIATLRRPHRFLAELDGRIAPEIDDWVPDADIIDPESPIDPQTLVKRFIDDDDGPPVRRHLFRNIAILVLALGLAAAWQWTPLRELLDIQTLFDAVTKIRQVSWAPALVLMGFVIGGLIALPVTLLIVVTVLVFGPWLGFIYAMTGSMLSAFATYAVGHHIGGEMVRRFAGSRVNRLSKRLARRGVLTMTVIRILPIAPFTVVNLVAGASHIRFRDFVLGTFLGMLPGILAVTLFVDRIDVALRNPQPANYALLTAVTVGIIVLVYSLRRLLTRQSERNHRTQEDAERSKG